MNKPLRKQTEEDDILREQEIAETTALFIEYFRNEFVNNPSRRLKGFLVLGDTIRLVQKKDLWHLCVLEGDTPPPARQGSIICTGTRNPMHRTMTALTIAYLVKSNLMKEAEEYPYKKFEIIFYDYPEYRHYKNKLMRYQKQDYRIPFMKVDIKW